MSRQPWHDFLLRAAPQPVAAGTLPEWVARIHELQADWPDTIEHALAAGFRADRVAWAFLAGYLAALRRLVPGLPNGRLAALCVTEKSGNRPRDIETRLETDGTGAMRLYGAKQFVTGGTAADLLLVAAGSGTDESGRRRIRLVQLAPDSPGVVIEALPELPFVPEIPHARLHFDATPVAPGQVLPGDGYADYVRPFRTIEDVHVTAAVGAWLLRVARAHDWPSPAIAELHALLLTLRAIAAEDASAPATHVALAGALDLFHGWLSRHARQWERTPADLRDAWQRDGQLLQVAASARGARIEAAWTQLAAGPLPD